MDYSIKKIGNVKDIDRVWELVNNVLVSDFPTYKKETIQAYRRGVYTKKYFRKTYRKKDNLLLGAISANNLIGFIGLKTDFGGVIYIDWLAVREEFRKKGIAGKLLKEVEKWALANKYHYIYFYTQDRENIAYYQKRNYKYVGSQYKSWFGEDLYILDKVLQDKPFKEIFSKALKI